jgi:recombination protein RecT
MATETKKKANLPALISQSESRIAEILPEGMDPKRVVRLARLAIHRNPDLMECDPVSVIEAILQASQLGLEIGSPIGGAHLVPFKRKCMMIPDYRALIRLALKAGACVKLVAREVYAVDHFEIMQGSADRIIHIPSIDSEPRLDEDIIAFYAVATVLDAGTLVTVHEWAPRGDVDKIRARAPAGRSGPWVTDYAAMGKKTMVKRVLKWLDLSPELGMAIELDNRAETGEAGGILPDDPEGLEAAEQMAEKTKAAREEMSERMQREREREIQGDEVPAGE